MQKLILIALIEREDNFKGQAHSSTIGKSFYITQEWLACQLQISESTIKRANKELEQLNYIQLHRHKGEATTYSINWNKINDFNRNFHFDDLNAQDLSSIKRDSITGEVAPQEVQVTKNSSRDIEDLPTSFNEIEDEFIRIMLNEKRQRPNASWEDVYPIVAEKTERSIDYVAAARKVLLCVDGLHDLFE